MFRPLLRTAAVAAAVASRRMLTTSIASHSAGTRSLALVAAAGGPVSSSFPIRSPSFGCFHLDMHILIFLCVKLGSKLLPLAARELERPMLNALFSAPAALSGGLFSQIIKACNKYVLYAGLAAACALIPAPLEAASVDYKAVRKVRVDSHQASTFSIVLTVTLRAQAIAGILDEENFDDGSIAPILIRLAWHGSGEASLLYSSRINRIVWPGSVLDRSSPRLWWKLSVFCGVSP